MKKIVLPLMIIITIGTQAAQIKKTTDYQSALSYLIKTYSQDVQQNNLSRLETAELICEINRDVADEDMDEACLIIEHN